MNRKLIFRIFIASFFLWNLTLTSCATKSGCPAYENVHVQPDKKGKLPTKGGKSQLFPKNMRPRG